MIIKINIANKRAVVEGAPVIVCGNSSYSIDFTFDDEWDGITQKTARFVYVRGGVLQHEDVNFTGTTVEVPFLVGIRYVQVGVFSGEKLSTTTPAKIPCEPSIRCEAGETAPSTVDAYNAGMQAGAGAIWDGIQNYGNRISYGSAFKSWMSTSINTKYAIKTDSLYEIFNACRNLETVPQIISANADDKFKSCYSAFGWCNKLKSIDFDITCSGTGGSIWQSAFTDCFELVHIQKVGALASQGFSGAFQNCHSLEEIRFDGEIGNTISFAWSSLLSTESVQSIIDHLADLTGAATQTVTFHTDVLAKLSDDQITTILSKNWAM